MIKFRGAKGWPFHVKPTPGPTLADRLATKTATDRYRTYKSWVYSHFGAKKLNDPKFHEEQLVKFSTRLANKNFEVEHFDEKTMFIWEYDMDPDRGQLVSVYAAGFDLVGVLHGIATDLRQGRWDENRAMVYQERIRLPVQEVLDDLDTSDTDPEA